MIIDAINTVKENPEGLYFVAGFVIIYWFWRSW
jgi:hypothetical protein